MSVYICLKYPFDPFKWRVELGTARYLGGCIFFLLRENYIYIIFIYNIYENYIYIIYIYLYNIYIYLLYVYIYKYHIYTYIYIDR